MTKITNELLEDYAMLYPRIECVIVKDMQKELVFSELYTPMQYAHARMEEGFGIEYIQLRSIESITDEEVKKISELLDLKDVEFYTVKGFLLSGKYYALTIVHQYLQSIGIAVNTIDKEANIITVDELIESGKLKLI